MKTLKQIYAFLTGYHAYILVLMAIVVGMPLSKFLMSVGTLCLVGQWFLAGNIMYKFNQFFKNKIAVICSITFIIFLLGLIHTSDFEYGFKDIRIKVPLLAFPVIFCTHHKLKAVHLKFILLLFIFSTLISTVYGYLAYHEILPAKKPITEIRDASQFISHIRLSLMVVLSMFMLPILSKEKWFFKLIGIAVFIWFAYFLSFIESATGFIIGCFTLFFVSIYLSFTNKNILAILPAAIMIIGGSYLTYKMATVYNSVKIDASSPMDKVTKYGQPYGETDFIMFDNGNFSNDYLCMKELEDTWNIRSNKNLYELDQNGNAYKFILIRYMTSKGLRKDREGVESLSEQDIKNIENGTANYLYSSHDLMSRLYLLMFEIDGYFNGASSNGNSLAQRIEYWKTSKEIVKENFLFGQGTGDVPNAFKQKYAANSSLTEQFQLRSHNQYLSTFIALGFIGVLIFVLTLILPLQYAIKRRNYYYVIFSCIALLSFLSEDTLETQDGVFLFAFFNSLFLFQLPKEMLKLKQHV